MTERIKILARIEQLRSGTKPFCVATIVRTADATSAKAGAKALVTDSGELEGYVGGGCVTGAVKRAGLGCIVSGEPRMIRIKPTEDVSGAIDDDGAAIYSSGCPSGGTVDIFLEPMLSTARVIVCGNSPVATALMSIVASVGFQAVHAVAKSESSQRGEVAATLEGFDFTHLGLQPRDSVIVSTQGANDKQALLAGLHSSAEYIGMVGSRKKIAYMKLQVENAVSAERLAELHGPAGLDIGAIAPEEIALSIVAEIVAFRRLQTANFVADDQPSIQ